MTRDYIFEVDAAKPNNREIVGIISEMLYIKSRLDPQFLDNLRKYWKDNKVDYRWIIEIKDAVEEVLKEDYDYNIYVIRSDIQAKVWQALKDYELKKMISNSQNGISY